MFSQKDVLNTLDMIEKRHLDIRTITMGISLLDCADPDLDVCCDKIYRKITTYAKDLVAYASHPLHLEAKEHFWHLLDSRVAADYEF